MKCPICNGKGGWREDMGEGTVLYEPCYECNESGNMPLEKYLWFWFWQYAPVSFVEWYSDTFYGKKGKKK